jgi:hypothetical protein
MDDASYVAGGANLVSTNTKIQASNDRLAANARATADAQVAGIVRAREAMRLNIANLSRIQAGGVGAAAGSRQAEEASAATILLQREQAKLARSYGETAIATAGFSSRTKAAEGEVNRISRGILAGSGIVSKFGRTLAFASSSFLGFAIGASLVSRTIRSAEDLAKAQASLDVAIQHTGGNLDELKGRYAAIAKAAAQFGVSQVDATTGLARATVLAGNAAAAQRAYQEALVISKATGKDFNSVLTATAKGQEGIVTSLRRYGILVDSGTKGTAQFAIVMRRFGGQAAANTSATDRLRASLSNAEAAIGTALLPTVERLATSFANWLEKMNRTGQLQRDVNTAVRDGAAIFRAIGAAIRFTDRVTGGLKNTLELLVAIKLATASSRWLRGIEAFTGGPGAGLLGAEVGAAKLLTKLRALAAIGVITIEIDLIEHFLQKYGLKGTLKGIVPTNTLGRDVSPDQTITVKGKSYPIGSAAAYQALINAGAKLPPIGKVTAAQEIRAARDLGGSASIPAPPRRRRPRPGQRRRPAAAPPPTAPSTAAVRSFTLPFRLQLAQAKASATATLSDDLKVAREIKAYILKVIPRLHGQQLIQAYDQLGQVNAEIASDVQQAAKKGKKLADSFSEPAKLQLAEARAQALGLPDTKILLKMKAAALKAIRSGKLSVQGQIDAWNEIASLNDQLGSSAQSALGAFKQASTAKLVRGLGLTADQQKRLRARLSQLGPGGTVPGGGTGAYGYVIDPATGRPVRPTVRQSRLPIPPSRRAIPDYSAARFNTLLRHLERIADRPIHLTVDLDGRVIADSTTRHQQRRRNRNPTQRRGPNAVTG